MSKNRFLVSLFSVPVYLFTLSTAAAQIVPAGTVNALAIVQGDVPTLYAGTGEGLYSSRNHGQDWDRSGLEGHSISDIAAGPTNGNIIYVAAGTNGVMKSINGGKDWSKLTINSPVNSPNQGQQDFRAVAIDRSSPKTVFAASFHGHIYRSTDEGQSWSTINAGFPFQALNTLAIDGDTLYAGTGKGILKSTDGGTNWKMVNTGLTNLTITRIVIDPTNAETLYAGTYGSGIFTSDNGGRSWKPANDGGLTNAFIYAMAAWSVADRGKSGLQDRRTDRPGAGLLVGVYGGTLFQGTAKDGIHWLPYNADTHRM